MKFRISLLLTTYLASATAFAATEVNLRNQSYDYLQRQPSKVKIKKIRSRTDFNQIEHVRIQQTFNDIPVWNATGVVHIPSTKQTHALAPKAIAMNGMIYEGLEKDLASSNHALSFSASQKTKSLQLAQATYSKKNNISNPKYKNEKSQPIIFVDDNKQAHYAYLSSFTYESTSAGVHRPTYIIDANNHHVYRTWDQVFTISEEEAIKQARASIHFKLSNDDDDLDLPDPSHPIKVGGIGGNEKTGPIIYDGDTGNRPGLDAKAMDINLDLDGAKISFTICALLNDDIAILDASLDNTVVNSICASHSKAHNDVAWLNLSKDHTQWKEDEINGAYSPSLDAFYAATMVKNMYQDWYGVPALIDEDGQARQYIMRVHYGRGFDNAFWDGDVMTFGDGDKLFYPLTSLEVTAHEISHGFTQTHSNIDGFYPQMAALHESFSDMAAVSLDYYLNNTNRWEIGRDVWKNEGAMRYLDNPRKDGESIDHLKDFDNTEPHHGAGITNKAFYLIATTKGWNTRKAFDIMVKANMDYWTSSMSTLNEAACGVIEATKDYHYNVADVRIAFAKVGINTDICEVK